MVFNRHFSKGYSFFLVLSSALKSSPVSAISFEIQRFDVQLLRFFSFFFYFSVSFYPIWIKIISKFRENVGLHAYRLG